MTAEPPAALAMVRPAPWSPPATLAMEFVRGPSGRTYLRRQYAAHPFHVCRPFYLAGDPAGMATLYLQSCSGGIFQGDRLSASVVVAEGALAHVTTQASTIVHSMEEGEARCSATLEVRAGALCEYLPDPLILFPRSRLSTTVRIRAHESATVVACESFLLHDPAGRGAAFDHLLSETVAETLAGDTLALDRFEISGGTAQEATPGIMGRYRSLGSLLILHRERPAAVLVETARRALESVAGIYGGASALPGGAGAWVRLLAEDGISLRTGLFQAWAALRLALAGEAPRRRRK